MYNFAIVGAAGYIAPRHMQAIKDVGGDLVAALDPHDSVGILDKYFPDCLYFREPERFDRWLSRNHVDYVSVASPNFLHDSHCLMAMRNGADVICEKPLVCHERNLDNLSEWEVKTGKKVNVVLQCRLHPEAVKAKIKYSNGSDYRVDVEYRVPRGNWYFASWKGDTEKSGGILANIGIHLFDLCVWLFGEPDYEFACIFDCDRDDVEGGFDLDRADVDFRLSVGQGMPKRIFRVDGESIDLTNGFTDLHTKTYEHILAGNGFGIEDIRPATRLVEAMRDGS